MVTAGLVATAFTTEARRDAAPVEVRNDLKLTLKPSYTVNFFATVDQVRVMTADELSRCICQGYCVWRTQAPFYGQWVRECVEGTNVFYIPGAGSAPPAPCDFCPPPPC